MYSSQYDLAENDILYFLHIERTGGTTFGLYLISHYADNQIFPHCRSWRSYFDLPQIDMTKIRYVVGHLGYRFYRYLPKKPVYITMLREPISRWLSLWQHMKVKSVLPDAKSEFFQKITLFDGLKFLPLRYRLMNNSVRSIALDPDDDTFNRIGNKTNFDDAWFTEITIDDVYCGISENELLETAKKRLATEFAFFGLTERYQESLFLLAHTFGWRPVRDIPIKNAISSTPKKDSISKDVLDDIAAVNKLDIDLYNYATSLFDKRFNLMVEELKRKYYSTRHEKMSLMDMVYDMLEQQYSERFAKSHIPSDTLEYRFDQPLPGDGWEVPEKDSQNRIYRWTGPQTVSTIDLPLTKDKDLVILIFVRAAVSSEILSSLKIEVNDDILEGHLTKLKPSGAIYQGIIESRLLKKNERSYTRIVLHVSKTLVPPIQGNPPDERLLGIAVDKITIVPIS